MGEKRAKSFAKLDIYTIGDLINHFPFRYIDYTKPVQITDTQFDEYVVIRAEVVSKMPAVRVKGNKELYKVIVMDETQSATIVFFNQYAVKKLIVGKEYLFYGKISGFSNSKQMMSPEFILAGTKYNLVPIYHLTKDIGQQYITKCINTALNSINDGFVDVISQNLMDKYGYMSYKDAILHIHKPIDITDSENAKKRLVFEELLILQLGLLYLKNKNKKSYGTPFLNQNLDEFYNSLPFTPTNSQMEAIKEICNDFKSEVSMNRLLQGDVGSGKTLVACAGMVIASQNNCQSVLMAPTEILATQHYNTLLNLLSPLNLSIGLLTGSLKGKEKKFVLQQIENGEIDIIVGTHAVISENVKFKNLKYVITDEQHRFGVKQRALLNNKASGNPHVLVMSATPIPRTLGLLIFGDLDISVIDEMPKGRQVIKTYLITSDKRKRMFDFIIKHKQMGEQAFIVCPLIENSENSEDLFAVTDYIENIAKPNLPNCNIALLHGKMKANDKAKIMEDFLNKKYDVLVSTTVIEVGVDVPNATIMVIENAERYGLSALHQLRGRVGRSSLESFCILVSDHKGENSKERLKVLCNTHDGFELSKYDMENRGVGDFFGNRQHGLPTLKLANLMTDTKELYIAQKLSQKIIENDKELNSYPVLKIRVNNLFKDNTVFN